MTLSALAKMSEDRWSIDGDAAECSGYEDQYSRHGSSVCTQHVHGTSPSAGCCQPYGLVSAWDGILSKITAGLVPELMSTYATTSGFWPIAVMSDSAAVPHETYRYITFKLDVRVLTDSGTANQSPRSKTVQS
nr:hypothetical protein CFP56_02737 [Quercus suber]